MVGGARQGWLSGVPGRAICVLALLCRALFPREDTVLSAQAVSVFIPEVTGTGSGPGDAAFFTQMIKMEVAARNYPLGETRAGSRYSMNGSLTPIVPVYEDPFDLDIFAARQYALHLALVANATEAILVEQDLVYTMPEDANEVLPLLVFTMLANIPPQQPAGISGEWRNKWWYFSAYGCWTPRIYTDTLQSASMANFGFGLAAAIQLLNFMSFETAVELAQDWVVISPYDYMEYRGHVLEIPALLKGVLKPASYFMVEPYAGVQVNIPINELISPPLFSWTAGVQYGVKAGPGAVFVDARFVMDIGDSTVTTKPGNETHHYHRYAVKLAAGYKIGVFPRKNKSRGIED